jgi:hypothetical protein
VTLWVRAGADAGGGDTVAALAATAPEG